MKNRSTSLTAAAFANLHEYQRIGWFMFRLFEREQRLNLDALERQWHLSSPPSWLNPVPFAGYLNHADCRDD